MNNESFSGYDWKTGHVCDFDKKFPSALSAWDKSSLKLKAGATHYGFVQEGEATLITETQGFITLKTGMYFCVHGDAGIVSGRGIVMSRYGFHGVFQIGGPVEQEGRLKYIDGCTDSLLIPPVKKGDPCLNLLCFPPGIDQTEHTHPSARVGLIFSGHGECVTPQGVIELKPGMMFNINTDGPHKFRTLFGVGMRVIAYHPDSDFGPTDTIHPMINRTIVDGLSASVIPEIQTK